MGVLNDVKNRSLRNPAPDAPLTGHTVSNPIDNSVPDDVVPVSIATGR
jgi:hypothetical protein